VKIKDTPLSQPRVWAPAILFDGPRAVGPPAVPMERVIRFATMLIESNNSALRRNISEKAKNALDTHNRTNLSCGHRFNSSLKSSTVRDLMKLLCSAFATFIVKIKDTSLSQPRVGRFIPCLSTATVPDDIELLDPREVLLEDCVVCTLPLTVSHAIKLSVAIDPLTSECS